MYPRSCVWALPNKRRWPGMGSRCARILLHFLLLFLLCVLASIIGSWDAYVHALTSSSGCGARLASSDVTDSAGQRRLWVCAAGVLESALGANAALTEQRVPAT